MRGIVVSLCLCPRIRFCPSNLFIRIDPYLGNTSLSRPCGGAYSQFLGLLRPHIPVRIKPSQLDTQAPNRSIKGLECQCVKALDYSQQSTSAYRARRKPIMARIYN